MGWINWVTIVLGGIFTLLLLAFRYIQKKHRFWEERGVKSVTLWDTVKSLFDQFHENIFFMELRFYKKYGRTYGYFPFFDASLTISDPELIKQIWVKDFHLFHSRRDFGAGDKVFGKMLSAVEGEDWKRIRSVMSPTFSSGKMRSMSLLIIECAEGLAQTIEESIQNKTTFGAKEAFGCYTMDVIASCAFGTKIESNRDPNNPFAKNAAKFFDPDAMGKLGFLQFIIMTAFPKLGSLIGLQTFGTFNDSVSFFSGMIDKIIKSRENIKEKPKDFLQLTLDAQRNETQEAEELEDNSVYGVGEETHKMFRLTAKQKKLSHDELVAQALLFFVVGYETTAVLLTTIAFHLALNPDIQDKLCEEVDKAVDEYAILDFDAVYKMQYLDRVVSESLRLYPPLPRIERKATVDYKLGDTGIVVPKGKIVGVPVCALHRDPEYFPNPEVFDPDRFLPEEKEKRHPFTYLPFGAGPRNCLAMRFALMEAKMGIVHILKNYKFLMPPETKVPMELKPGGLSSPKNFRLAAERRDVVILS